MEKKSILVVENSSSSTHDVFLTLFLKQLTQDEKKNTSIIEYLLNNEH